MSATPLVTLGLHLERDVVLVRQRSRLLAELLGFEGQDQTRIATAVSEIARNAYEYAGGGRVEFEAELGSRPQALVIRVSDQGPGIADPDSVLEGRYRSKTGMGLGITGSRRMMDALELETSAGRGTSVTMRKRLPARARTLEVRDLRRVVELVSKDRPHDSMAEVQQQNQELLAALDMLRLREEERNLLLEREREARAAAEAAILVRDNVLSVVSHDLRNPVNLVLNASLFLIDEVVPADFAGAEQLRLIVRAARRASRLIEDLLDVTRIESRGIELEVGPESALSLLEEAVEMLRPAAELKEVDLEVRAQADLPLVLADRGRLLQVLDNLGGNAVKFARQGGVVQLCAERRGDRVVLVVADDGPGMTPEQLEHAFDRFWQARRSDRRGVGLGLGIASGIVKAHGGTLRATSEPDRGCVFRFDLPVAPGEECVSA